MKPRKRYKDEADVLKAIENAYAKRDQLKARAAMLDDASVTPDKLNWLDVEKWFQEHSSDTMPDMGYRKRISEKLWKRANAMDDGILKKLGQKLSVIRTQTMFAGDDGSVEA